MTVEDATAPPPSRWATFLVAVDDQVATERRAASYPATALEEVRRATARTARGSSARSLDPELSLIATASEVDVAVPIASKLPGVAPVKKLLRKLMSWYVQYLAQQVATLGGAVLRLGKATARELGRLDEDVTELRHRVERLEGGPPSERPIS